MADPSYWGDDEEDKKQKAYEQGLQDDARADPDGFLNLQRYVGVNEGKGLEMAHSAADQVSTQGDALKGEVDTAKTEFDASKNAATLDNPYSYAQGYYSPDQNGGGLSADTSKGSGKGKGGGSLSGETEPSSGDYAQTYDWDPNMTADDADARSKQTYTGPNGLKDNDFAARSKTVGDLATDVGSGTGLASRASALFGGDKAEGSYGAGMSAYDAALAGATGGGELSAIQAKYGGLEKYVTGAQDDAAKAAQLASDTTTTNASKYGDIAGHMHAADAAAANAAAIQASGDSARDASYAGKESWDDYINNNRFENTLHQMSNYVAYTDPIEAANSVGGNASLVDSVNPGADAYANKNYGTTLNSTKIDWAHRMPGANDFGRKMVYDSLTTADLHKVERMGWAEQERYLFDRLQAVYQKLAIDGKHTAERGVPNRIPAGKNRDQVVNDQVNENFIGLNRIGR